MATRQSTARSRSEMGWLPGMMMATFVIGTDDFLIAGILPELALAFDASHAAAGQLVTVFSFVYAVAAPVLAVLTARLPRRALLVGGLAAFAVINLITALAPTYFSMMLLRIVAALLAAAITPAVFAITGALAPPERLGRAIGSVAAGLTLSLVFGVPLGSWVSAMFDWRATFVVVAGMTIVAVAVIASTVPIIPGRWETGIRERLALLRRPAVMAGVGSSVLGATSGLMPYIFIAPILGDISMLSRELVPSAIAIFGLSGALGTAIGGRLNDRWGTDRTFLLLLALVAGAIAILAWIGVGFDGSTPLWLLAGVIMIWGGASWGYNPPMNARALRLAGAAGTEAIALNTSGLYVGIAAAGAIGGVALSFGGGAATLLAAAIIGVVNLVFTVIVVRRFPSSPHIPRIQDDVETQGGSS